MEKNRRVWEHMWTWRNIFYPQGYPRRASWCLGSYGCQTLGHDNVTVGLSVIDDVSAAVVFCTGSAIDDGSVSIVKLCSWLLFVWFMCLMFCTYLGLQEFGHCRPWYPHLATTISYFWMLVRRIRPSSSSLTSSTTIS